MVIQSGGVKKDLQVSIDSAEKPAGSNWVVIEPLACGPQPLRKAATEECQIPFLRILEAEKRKSISYVVWTFPPGMHIQ